jgi:hypothetical protein
LRFATAAKTVPPPCPKFPTSTSTARSRGEAALAYCEGLTDYDLPGLPPLHAGLAEPFAQKQVAEIAATGINKNLWTRLKLAQSAIPVPE